MEEGPTIQVPKENNDERKNKKIPQCLNNFKIVERDQIDTPTHKYMTANTQIHDH